MAIRPAQGTGFLTGMDLSRCDEVRLADCWGTKEEHLRPGDGNIDFAMVFRRLDELGFKGHYMNAFGSLDDMLAGRDDLVRLAEAAGIDIG